jgi:hypothetical protein
VITFLYLIVENNFSARLTAERGNGTAVEYIMIPDDLSVKNRAEHLGPLRPTDRATSQLLQKSDFHLRPAVRTLHSGTFSFAWFK